MRRLLVMAMMVCLMAMAAGPVRAEGTPPPASEFAALPKGTREKVEDLSARLRKEVAEKLSTPPSAKKINAKEELDAFCTASDLVELIGIDQAELREPAYQLLLESRNKDLKAKDIERLCQYLAPAPPDKNLQGQRAGVVLAKNQALGVPALKDMLRSLKNPLSRVHAACALFEAEAGVEEPVKRHAQEVLLGSLGKIEPMDKIEPWMISGLVKALLAAKDDSPLWGKGIAALWPCEFDFKGQEELVHSVFIRALKTPTFDVRQNALFGLRRLGFRKEDLEPYQALLRDADLHIHDRLFCELINKPEPWMVPLFMEGLAETDVRTQGTCVRTLVKLKHKAAVPKLVEIFKKAMNSGKDPFSREDPFQDNPCRAVGQAIADLSGQPFDFVLKMRDLGGPGFRAEQPYDRSDVYKAEAVKLLKWWEETGSKQEW
jgi:HEAT repeat protein